MSTNLTFDQYAHIICYDYGFMPEPEGKYEPNWNPETDECYFTFAKARQGHNVIIMFHADDLQKEWAVTGTLAPDATCNFKTFGWYNGRNCGRRIDGAFFIWWNDIDTWYISSVLGTPGTAYWDKTGRYISGDYTPRGTATGVATVAEGEHPPP